MNPIVVPTGESALTVMFGEMVDARLNERVVSLDQSLTDDPLPGVMEVVPALASLLVRFDPMIASRAELSGAVLERTLRDTRDQRVGRWWHLPAHYGGVHGPDLPDVADALGLSEDEAIEAHAGLELRVLMLGFAPGLAYLGIAPERWDLPRRPDVRPRVEAGAVVVAVRQTVVTGTPIPTGWHSIAHTPVPTFQPGSADPFRFRPGDVVTFEPVSLAEHTIISERIEAGTLAFTPTEPS